MTSNTKLIWRTMKGERGRYLAAIAVLVFAISFMYLVPLVITLVIDGVLPEQPEPDIRFMVIVERAGGSVFLRDHLWLAAVAIAALTALAGFFTYLRGRWGAQATERIARRLRNRLYDQLQHVPCAYHDATETGDQVQRCTSDVETFRLFLSSQVIEIGRAVFMMLVPLPIMLTLDPGMTLVSTVVIPPIVAFSYFFFRRVQKVFKQVDEAEGRLTSAVQENLTGIRVVRAFARQEFENQKFSERNRAYQDLDRRFFGLLAGL